MEQEKTKDERPWTRYTESKPEADRIRVPSGCLFQVKRIRGIHGAKIYGGIPVPASSKPAGEILDELPQAVSTTWAMTARENAYRELVDGVVNEDTGEVIAVDVMQVEYEDYLAVTNHALGWVDKAAEEVGRSLR